MKNCIKCKKEKPLKDFYFRKDCNNYRNSCIECEKARVGKYYHKNKEARSLKAKEYYKEHKEQIKGRVKAWYDNIKDCPVFREKERLRGRVWRKNNPQKNAKRQRKRVQKLKERTPFWLSPKDQIEIFNIYKECKKLNLKSKEYYYHVDHIIPLQGAEVSGLHVPWNLQIIEAVSNIKKSNKIRSL